MPPPSALPSSIQVGHDVLVLAGERAAGAAQPGLDLVGDHQHVRPVTELARAAADSPPAG